VNAAQSTLTVFWKPTRAAERHDLTVVSSLAEDRARRRPGCVLEREPDIFPTINDHSPHKCLQKLHTSKQNQVYNYLIFWTKSTKHAIFPLANQVNQADDRERS
jgi:hypothetical protein